MRDGGKKLPSSQPDLLAELALALADLNWREAPVWLAIATTAKKILQDSSSNVRPLVSASSRSSTSSSRQFSHMQMVREHSQHSINDYTNSAGSNTLTSSNRSPSSSMRSATHIGASDYADGSAMLMAASGHLDTSSRSTSSNGTSTSNGNYGSSSSSSTSTQGLPIRLDNLSTIVPKQVTTFYAQDLVMLASAVSPTGYKDDALLDSLADAAVWKISLLSLQELTSLAQCYARFLHPHPQLTAAICNAVEKQVKGDRVTLMLECVSYLCDLGHKPKRLVTSTARLVMDEGVKLRLEETVGLLTAMAKVGYNASVQLGKLARAMLVHPLDDWTPAQLAAVAWSLGQLGYSHKEVLAVVQAAASVDMQRFTAGQIVQLLQGFAMLGLSNSYLERTAVYCIMADLQSGISSSALGDTTALSASQQGDLILALQQLGRQDLCKQLTAAFAGAGDSEQTMQLTPVFD